MRKVFVVTTGSYSDYGIDCIFSSKEKAQEYIDLFPSNEYNDIEEYTLDFANAAIARKKRGLCVFTVDMLKDGTTIRIGKHDNSTLENHEQFVKYYPNREWLKPNQGYYLSISVWAKDEKHAVKIANEKRAMHIANNTWKDN